MKLPGHRFVLVQGPDGSEHVPSVHDSFRLAVETAPERPLLCVLPETAAVYGIKAQEITYAGVAREVDRLIADYQAAGAMPGQRVMIRLENRPEFLFHFLALNALGLSILPVNPDLKVAELAYQIAHADPVLAVVTPDSVAMLKAAAVEAGSDMQVTSGALPRLSKRARLIEEGEAALLYTSGTTGNPKGCVLGNEYFRRCGVWYASTGGLMDLRDAPRMITPLPLFHMNALACSFMAMIFSLGCLTVLDRFHPSTWWQSVRASRATCLHYLGVMPSILMQVPPQPSDQDHHVEFGFGAGIDPKLHAPFEERFGFPLIEAWAMTETGNAGVIAASHPPRLVGHSALGRLGDGTEARIVDDTGQDTREGELLVRSSIGEPRFGFFRSYWRDPEATEAAWAGGWFHTGDIVRQDDAGVFYFVDRKKNVIRRSGENIAAVEVESLLMRHKDVQAAGVAAVPDSIRGDEVFACLKVAEPNADTARAIAQWALGQMAYYKVPGYIAFVEALPLTATQKIQRKALKELVLSLLDDSETINCTDLKKRQVA